MTCPQGSSYLRGSGHHAGPITSLAVVLDRSQEGAEARAPEEAAVEPAAEAPCQLRSTRRDPRSRIIGHNNKYLLEEIYYG